MHNAGYLAAGIDDKFVFVCCEVDEVDTAKIAEFVRTMGIRALTCTNPHNTRILKYLDHIDPAAELIGSVNTVVNEGGRLIGYNTDWIGAATAIECVSKVEGMNAAVLGTGGAAAAVAFGLRSRGAVVTIFGRAADKASKLAGSIGCTVGTVDRISMLADYDVIVNATPVGKSPLENASLVPQACLRPGQVVMDVVYVPLKTRLLVEAERCGAQVVPGSEMLLHQGVAQFEIQTRYEAPVEAMRRALVSCLGGPRNED
jgi:shikimate dehydrogenase